MYTKGHLVHRPKKSIEFVHRQKKPIEFERGTCRCRSRVKVT